MAMTNMKRHTFSCVLPAPLERVRLRLRSCMSLSEPGSRWMHPRARSSSRGSDGTSVKCGCIPMPEQRPRPKPSRRERTRWETTSYSGTMNSIEAELRGGPCWRMNWPRRPTGCEPIGGFRGARRSHAVAIHGAAPATGGQPDEPLNDALAQQGLSDLLDELFDKIREQRDAGRVDRAESEARFRRFSFRRIRRCSAWSSRSPPVVRRCPRAWQSCAKA